MFKNLTYKKKIKLLYAVAIVFSIFAYRLAIAKTLELRSSSVEQENMLGGVDNLSLDIAILQKKLSETDAFLSSDTTDSRIFLIDKITEYCKANNTVLKALPSKIISKQGNFVFETNVFTVQGNFEKLLKLQYSLEQKNIGGRISSVHFKTNKNNNTRTTELTSEIYIQSAKKIN